MRVGRHWTYQVRTGFDRRVEEIKVVRELTVASSDGYELAGPLGAGMADSGQDLERGARLGE